MKELDITQILERILDEFKELKESNRRIEQRIVKIEEKALIILDRFENFEEMAKNRLDKMDARLIKETFRQRATLEESDSRLEEKDRMQDEKIEQIVSKVK